ncbi:MAG: hypothetical protein KAQ94_06170 [Arcobacteraceae bacterium]|nr:hypothetical protein [Arcobacteraceae bacterium]
MKLGILLLAIGSIIAFYLTKIKIEKKFLTKLGIVFGILLALYGLILLVQPDDYIKFTKTTISSKE